MVTTQLLGRDYFASGDTLDEFALLEIIGGGGEGGVWSAWDSFNKRIVALKFFQLDETTRTIDKRREELLALSRIEHPNIRKIYKTGDGVGFMYFVMAYYPSGSLSNLVGGKPLPVESALKIAAQITTALEYIHERKVIHRDLKPTNILIDHYKHAFLTDFGIARTLSDSTMALHTGQGTPAYSSPEQHTKAYIDVQTDIYSFGVMLYEMFSGEPPWQGLSSLAIKQLESGVKIPDPRESNPALPEGLHHVLKKLTAQSPEERPSTIREAYQLVLEVWVQTAATVESVLAQVPPAGLPDEDAQKEAGDLLARAMGSWRSLEGHYRMGLTSFIYLNNVYRLPGPLSTLNQGQISFLAMFSIVHGRAMNYWWEKVEDPKRKLAISENIFAKEVGSPVLNLLTIMLDDPTQFAGASGANEEIIQSVLGKITETEDFAVRQKAIVLVDTLMEQAEEWQPEGFSSEMDHQLAEMSLSDEIYALDAAQLIGKIKSEAAVEIIREAVEEGEVEAGGESLAMIRKTAGDWPADTPSGIRMQTWMNIFREQVLTDWIEMRRTFLISWLGAGLAFFFNVFLTTRLPSYLIASRLLNSIGSGLFFGPFVGAGVMVTRWISTRLMVLGKASRTAAGIITGGLLVNLGFVLFHLLFLSSPPSGFLILSGSLIFTIGFGLGEILGLPKVWKAVISAVFVLGGLALTNSFAKILAVSPMLYYESGEPLQTVLFMIGFSCIIGSIIYLFQDAKPTEISVLE